MIAIILRQPNGDGTWSDRIGLTTGDSAVTVAGFPCLPGWIGDGDVSEWSHRLNISQARSWTSRLTSTSSPALRVLDITGTPGTYDSPTLSTSSSRPWMAKVWALGNPLAPVPAAGWSVGQIKY